MTIKLQLRQFGDLTSADFASHPVWIACHIVDCDEPWYDDTDEETFRPWTGALPVGPEEGMLLVRAQMTLADGRSFEGFITPQHDGEWLNLGTIQPQLFLPSGSRADFWDGMFKRADDRRTSVYSELGSDPSSVFPIHFRADNGLVTGQVSGEIPGFCWRPDDTVYVYR
jgi:hypothetical protein